MIYAFKCGCGNREEKTTRERFPCHNCGDLMGRDYSSLTLSPSPFQPHFNHAVGEYVQSSRGFDEALKRKNDEQCQRTGTDHSYTRVEPGDIPTPRKDDAIFETRNKLIRDKGIRMPEVR